MAALAGGGLGDLAGDVLGLVAGAEARVLVAQLVEGLRGHGRGEEAVVEGAVLDLVARGVGVVRRQLRGLDLGPGYHDVEPGDHAVPPVAVLPPVQRHVVRLHVGRDRLELVDDRVARGARGGVAQRVHQADGGNGHGQGRELLAVCNGGFVEGLAGELALLFFSFFFLRYLLGWDLSGGDLPCCSPSE